MQFDFTPLRSTSTGFSCEWKREPPAAVRRAGGFAFGALFQDERTKVSPLAGEKKRIVQSIATVGLLSMFEMMAMVKSASVNIAPPMTVPLAFRWFSVMGISQMA